MTEKTPWRKLQNKDYLGEYDFSTGEEKIVTIKGIITKDVTGDGGQVSAKPIMTFHEAVKPLIVNTTNFKMMQKLFKSKFVEDWYGKQIILYGDPNVKFGREIVGGVRVKNTLPLSKPQTIPACADCGQVIGEKDGFSVEQIIKAGLARYGRTVCMDCANALKAKPQEEKEEVNDENNADQN